MSQHPVTWWQAVLLGLIQGLTEFIPVSSSAHLNIVHWLFGQDRELAFDVMLHVGTLLALIVYFRHDWLQLLRDPGSAGLRNLVLLACIPAALAGLLLRDLEESHPLFKDVRFNAIMLAVLGMLLWTADHLGRKRRDLEDTNWKDALLIGSSQALALLPGVSRSGATITAGLFRRLTREAAARFSFLMSVPITLGAVTFEFYGKVLKPGERGLNAAPEVMLLGIATSAISGFWAIGFLLNYLRDRDVTIFVLWRFIIAAMVFILFPIIHR